MVTRFVKLRVEKKVDIEKMLGELRRIKGVYEAAVSGKGVNDVNYLVKADEDMVDELKKYCTPTILAQI